MNKKHLQGKCVLPLQKRKPHSGKWLSVAKPLRAEENEDKRTVPGEDPEPRAVKTVLQFAGPWLKAGAGNTRKSKLAEVRV